MHNDQPLSMPVDLPWPGDWMVGTSTGGILCLALATGKTPMDCQVSCSLHITLVLLSTSCFNSFTSPESLLQAEGQGVCWQATV